MVCAPDVTSPILQDPLMPRCVVPEVPFATVKGEVRDPAAFSQLQA
jgi:hypothetical protein